DQVTGISISPDGRKIASCSGGPERDFSIRIWETKEGVSFWEPQGPIQVQVLRGHEGSVEGVAFSPDGKQLFSCSWDQTIICWDVESANPVGLIRTGAKLKCMGIFPDGRRLVAGGEDGVVRIWDDIPRAFGAIFTPARLDLESNAWEFTYSPDGS